MVAEGGGSGNGRAKMSLSPNLAADRGRARVVLPPRESRGRGISFAALRKKIYGSDAYAVRDRAGFPAPTRILAVILRVGMRCGVC